MRKTYILRGSHLVEKGSPTDSFLSSSSGYYQVLPDIKPFVTQDGTHITSRSGVRAYEQKHGVRQVGNDFATQHRELRQKVRGRD